MRNLTKNRFNAVTKAGMACCLSLILLSIVPSRLLGNERRNPEWTKDFTHGWTPSSKLQCEIPEKIRAPELEKLQKSIVRSKDCNVWEELDNERDGKDRLWHSQRKGYLFCADELSNAQSMIDEVLLEIFSKDQAREWLHQYFACDKKLLQALFPMSDATATNLVSSCSSKSLKFWQSQKISIGENFQGTWKEFFSNLAPYTRFKRKILFLVGNTPEDCVDSFTFSHGPIVVGLPTGELKHETLKTLLWHELLIAMDAKNPFPLDMTEPERIWSHFKRTDDIGRSVLFQSRRLLIASAALRAFLFEAKGLGSNFPLPRLDELKKDNDLCLETLARALHWTETVPKKWIGLDSISAALVFQKTNEYRGPAGPMIDLDSWDSKSNDEIIGEIKRLSSPESAAPSLCRYLITPELSGINILDAGGPRPRIRSGGGKF